MATSVTTTTAAIDEALKIIFSDPLIVNIVEDSELLSIFQTDMNVKVDDTTGGRFIEMAHYFQLPAGVGARADIHGSGSRTRRRDAEYLPIARVGTGIHVNLDRTRH